jgi:predicted CXXCH cytochrome family protein
MTAKSKSLLVVVGVVALVAMLVPGVAFANAGVHGNYAMDTDQCAGCHRAHTAPSTITWNNGNTTTDALQRTNSGFALGERSALLIGNATSIQEFCYTCHGANAQGADTNVELGVYEDQSLASYGRWGVDGAPLISGPFGRPGVALDGEDPDETYDWTGKLVTSAHPSGPGEWPAWGGGSIGVTAGVFPQYDASIGLAGNGETAVKVGCDGCHDVHGTSNYRLLKNEVYGVNVGGYSGAVPTPFVSSVETGYPSGGFAKGTDYVAAGYQPNYTTPNYAKPSDPRKGMSGWCVGCHTYYMGELNVSDTQRYTVYSGVEATQHRHPVNVPLSNFDGGGTDVSAESTTNAAMQLPLAHGANGDGNETDDWLDCLTCHTAHGTTAVMEGWAATQMNPPTWSPPILSGGAGPSDDSALLRFDNRYVCQACHVK